MRRAGTLLAVLVAASGAFPGAVLAASPAKRMVHAINLLRAARGLPRVRFSPSLAHSSRRYARKLMRRDVFIHGSRIRASRSFDLLGEVLELHPSYNPRVAWTANRWLRSPTHRAVILSPRMRYLGAGRARGRFLGHSSTIWVAQLGSR